VQDLLQALDGVLPHDALQRAQAAAVGRLPYRVRQRPCCLVLHHVQGIVAVAGRKLRHPAGAPLHTRQESIKRLPVFQNRIPAVRCLSWLDVCSG
jgi:hypothetical protein